MSIDFNNLYRSFREPPKPLTKSELQQKNWENLFETGVDDDIVSGIMPDAMALARQQDDSAINYITNNTELIKAQNERTKWAENYVAERYNFMKYKNIKSNNKEWEPPFDLYVDEEDIDGTFSRLNIEVKRGQKLSATNPKGWRYTPLQEQALQNKELFVIQVTTTRTSIINKFKIHIELIRRYAPK